MIIIIEGNYAIQERGERNIFLLGGLEEFSQGKLQKSCRVEIKPKLI